MLVRLLLALTATFAATAANGDQPGFQIWNPPLLERLRAELASPASASARHPAILRLRADADRARRTAPTSVLDKSKRAPSGDPRDYYSIAPYWWPDPAQPDGLPFIWRDGQVNPTAKEGTDSDAFKEMADRVEALALAWHLFNDDDAAAHAVRQLDRWFLDPRTGMNPHLEYAQEIPGVRTGSGIGIIGLRRLVLVLDAVRALRPHPAWTTERDAAFFAWCQNYYVWLRDSAHGRLADEQHNNHGTFYDLQRVHLARFLEREDEARPVLARGIEGRLRQHVADDGSQPHEQRRTRGLYYSIVNLAGLALLADSAAALGLDWWQDPRLPRAMLFLGQFLDPEQPWPHSEIDNWPRVAIAPVLALAPPGVLPTQLDQAWRQVAATSPDRWVITGVPPL